MSQLELLSNSDSVPTALSAPARNKTSGCAGLGLSTEDRRERRASAVKTSGPTKAAATAHRCGDRGNPLPPGERSGRSDGTSASLGLSSLTRGAQVIYDHLDEQLRSTREIALDAGFIVKGTARHLAALAGGGLAVEHNGGWRRA